MEKSWPSSKTITAHQQIWHINENLDIDVLIKLNNTISFWENINDENNLKHCPDDDYGDRFK